jgi:hypothetical protein
MWIKRCLCGLIAVIVALLPIFVCWLLIVRAMEQHSATGSSKAPNPAKAPTWMLDPVDALVYVDPWFAGTVIFWIIPGLFILVGLVLWAASVLVFRRDATSSPRCLSVAKLLLTSAAVGLFLAIPWLYALSRVLSHGLD